MLNRINPNISVDCVIFGFDFKKLYVLLVERSLPYNNSKKPIFTDHTLAGNHIYEHEDLEEAARRIVRDLTGFEGFYMEQFQALAHPDRLKKDKDQLWLQRIGYNPNNRVITVGYFVLLDKNSMEFKLSSRKVTWFPINKIPELAFDHDIILGRALESLRARIQVSPVGYRLLPRKFSLFQLQTLFEVVFAVKFDKRNFRKKALKLKYLIPLNEKQSNVSHKPAQLFMFSHEVYEMTRKEFFDFAI